MFEGVGAVERAQELSAAVGATSAAVLLAIPARGRRPGRPAGGVERATVSTSWTLRLPGGSRACVGIALGGLM